MTKTCLFLPIIDIMLIRNAPQKAAIIKVEMIISKGKCGCEVPILNDLTSWKYPPLRAKDHIDYYCFPRIKPLDLHCLWK
jgi:hypothetical protein